MLPTFSLDYPYKYLATGLGARSNAQNLLRLNIRLNIDIELALEEQG